MVTGITAYKRRSSNELREGFSFSNITNNIGFVMEKKVSLQNIIGI